MLERARIIPGLDGVRALAIIAVLLFHMHGPLLPGGFIGVDVFFVLSGFLITTLLIREKAKKKRVDLPQFWLRRARRLVPAIVVLVLVTVPAGFVVGKDLLVGIERQVFGALTFSSNWVEIFAGTSYFARTSPQMYANLWSLAVEEQFYLLWPLLFGVLLAVTRTWRARVVFALLAMAASAGAMALLVRPFEDATRVYYGADTHAFGLLLGVALAFGWARRSFLDSALFQRLATPIGLLAFGGLVWLMSTLDEHVLFTFRGGLLLACLLTAVVIACLLHGQGALVRAASFRPLVWVGERSYGIYLWHWPALLIATALLPATALDSPAYWGVRTGGIVLTFLLAAWSYRAVETPIRTEGFQGAFRRWFGALRTPALLPKLVALGVTAAVALTATGIALAPQKSQTQLAIEAGDADLSDRTALLEPPAAGMRDGPTTSPAVPPAGGSTVPAGGASSTEPAEPSPTPVKVPRPPADGPHVTVFGDSIIVTALHGLKAALPGLHVSAKSNMQWKDAARIVQTELQAGRVRDYVVIGYGTNAGARNAEAIRAVLDLLGPERRIILVNLYSRSTFIPASNQTLALIAQERENVTLADWNSWVQKKPGMLQSDGIHPNIRGGHYFAELIRAALDEARERWLLSD